MKDAKTYYRDLLAHDIEPIAIHVLGEPTARTGDELGFNCPNHASSSCKSLTVTPRTGAWYCFGCSVGGDALQLVEFARHNSITVGVSGRMPDTHRKARDELAAIVGMEPLSGAGLGEAELKAIEANRREYVAVFGALHEIARHMHHRLMAPENEKVRAWALEKWGFDDDVLRRFGLGYDDQVGSVSSNAISQRLAADGKPSENRDLIKTGYYYEHEQHGIISCQFERFVFPYFVRGLCQYVIGRSTPWTTFHPEAKYRKLRRHRGGQNRDVSELIEHPIFGLQVLEQRPDDIVITEGVADAVASSAAGFPTISPVTTTFRKEDADMIARELANKCKRVTIIQDVEVSRVGLAAALRTSTLLREASINVRVGVLPLNADQQGAVDELREKLGDEFETWGSLRTIKEKEAVANEAGCTLAAINELTNKAKADVAEFLKAGPRQANAYANIIAGAQEPMVVACETAPVFTDPTRQSEALRPLLEEVSELRPIAQQKAIVLISERTGLATGVIRAELIEARRASISRERKARDDGKALQPIAPAGEKGSLKAIINDQVDKALQAKIPIDWGALARDVYDWFESSDDAAFFTDREGTNPRLFYRRRVYQISSSCLPFIDVFVDLTGLAPTSLPGKTIINTLAAKTTRRGEVRDRISWLHTDRRDHRIFMQLENSDAEIVRITPDGCEAVPNGQNVDRVVLGETRMRPIELVTESDEPEAIFDRLIGRYLCCSDIGRQLIRDWLFCFPLLEFADTRPMLRLEGPSGSGKTSAAKFLGTAVYGTEVQKTSTVPALYADSEINPLALIDNLETDGMKPEVLDFFIMVVTGITREKMTAGTTSGIDRVRPLQLVASTGIEPLSPALDEVVSRSLTVRFDLADLTESVSLEVALQELREGRHELLSAIFDRAAVVLTLIRDGALATVLALLRASLPVNHPKARAVPFLALIYLQRVAAAHPDDRPRMLKAVDPTFYVMMADQQEGTLETGAESNPIVNLVQLAFQVLRQTAAATSTMPDQVRSGPVGGLHFDATAKRFACTASELFIAFRALGKLWNVPVPYENPTQLARRLGMSVEAMTSAGYIVEKLPKSGNRNVWKVVDTNTVGDVEDDEEAEVHESSPDLVGF